MPAMTSLGVTSESASARPISIIALGWSLSLFLVISFVLCVVGYYLLPAAPIKHEALSIFLPGFEFGSAAGFFIGLLESFVWGWYIALLFGSLYNLIQTRLAGRDTERSS